MFGERKERKRKAGVLGRHALPRPPCIAVVWLSPTADTLRSLGALCEQSRKTRRLANLCCAPGNASGNSSLLLSAATALALPQTLRDGVLSAVSPIKTAHTHTRSKPPSDGVSTRPAVFSFCERETILESRSFVSAAC